MLAAPSR